MMKERECGCTHGPSAERLEEFGGDLADWVAPAILVEATLRAAEAAWGSETISPSSFSPAGMGALLTYCYARAIYDSGEIEFRVTRQPGWRQLGEKASPDQNTIRQFRRGNLEKLRESLARVLEQLCARGFCEGARSGLPPGPARTDSGNRLRVRSEFFKGADLRLMLAAQADSMALDE